MNFYETKLGDIFFNTQLPALIEALNTLSETLKKPAAPVIKLPVSVSPDYLTEFYYGNLEPDTKIDSPEIRQHTKNAIKIQETLKQRLSDEDWELVQQLQSVIDARSCDENAKSFQTGFCTAIQMVAAGLAAPCAEDTGGDLNE